MEAASKYSVIMGDVLDLDEKKRSGNYLIYGNRIRFKSVVGYNAD
jgi:hypothetical protein